MAVFVASFLPVNTHDFVPTFSPRPDPASVCLARRMAGVPCPTCGMTRSFRAVGQGALGEAFAFHPLGPVLYGVFIVVMVRSGGIAIAGRRWLDGTTRALVVAIPVLVVAAAVLWIVRLALFFASGAGAESWHASPLGRIFS